jgi:hypothetical protein
MPKLKTEKSKKAYRELNDLRRNIRNMSLDDTERYVKSESLSRILGPKYKAGLR